MMVPAAVEERLGAVEAHVEPVRRLDRHCEPQLLGPGLRRVRRLHPDDAVVLPEVVESGAEPIRVEQLITVGGNHRRRRRGQVVSPRVCATVADVPTLARTSTRPQCYPVRAAQLPARPPGRPAGLTILRAISTGFALPVG